MNINLKKQFLSTNVVCFDLYLGHQNAEIERTKELAKVSALRDELEAHFARIGKACGVTSRANGLFKKVKDCELASSESASRRRKI